MADASVAAPHEAGAGVELTLAPGRSIGRTRRGIPPMLEDADLSAHNGSMVEP